MRPGSLLSALRNVPRSIAFLSRRPREANARKANAQEANAKIPSIRQTCMMNDTVQMAL